MTEDQFKFRAFVVFLAIVMVLSAYKYSTPFQDLYKLFMMLTFVLAVLVLPALILYTVARKKKTTKL
jgi:integral membrane sensor domain MASE1